MVNSQMEPKLSFTLPSLHDNTTLDCRIYYAFPEDEPIRSWCTRGAIIAHPYAPLGGSYDDPVVGLVVKEILANHFGFVCTFNFRGVYGGSGHTSWTGKAERTDYESVVGFMIDFLHGLDSKSNPQEQIFGRDDKIPQPVQLVLGGYSYGSWICTHLPDPRDVLKQFEDAEEGGAATEIKARAQHLATQTNMELKAACAEALSRKGHTLSVGGDETSPEKRRRSGESSPARFTQDLRKSLDFARKIGSIRRKRPDGSEPSTPVHDNNNDECEAPASREQQISAAYLLISPLLPPISAFTTLPFGSNALRGQSEDVLEKLSTNPALAVFGNDDAFTSVKKLRTWAQDLSSRPTSQFHFVEVDGAGHFWRTSEAQKSLKMAVGHWIRCLKEQHGSVPVTEDVAGRQ